MQTLNKSGTAQGHLQAASRTPLSESDDVDLEGPVVKATTSHDSAATGMNRHHRGSVQATGPAHLQQESVQAATLAHLPKHDLAQAAGNAQTPASNQIPMGNKKAKRCTNCANWHRGKCNTPVCAHCGLGHGLKQACYQAKERFKQAGLLADNTREASPANSSTMSDIRQTLLDLGVSGLSQMIMNLDANGAAAMGELFNNMGRAKRKAEDDESTETQQMAKKAKKAEPSSSSQKPNKPIAKGRSQGGGSRDTSAFSRR
jgi:hypothetical protein